MFDIKSQHHQRGNRLIEPGREDYSPPGLWGICSSFPHCGVKPWLDSRSGHPPSPHFRPRAALPDLKDSVVLQLRSRLLPVMRLRVHVRAPLISSPRSAWNAAINYIYRMAPGNDAQHQGGG